MKLCLRFLISMLVLLCILIVPVVTIYADDTNVLDGSGTLEDPFVIYTSEDLNAISNNMNASYALGANISLSGANFEAIGSSDVPFTGTFDGKGHSISNLTFVTSEKNIEPVKVGLFVYTKGATIHDVVIDNVTIDVTVLKTNNTADIGIVSLNDLSSNFSNIDVNGSIKASAYYVTVGGAVCKASNTECININNNLRVNVKAGEYSETNTKQIVGGIIASSKSSTINNCTLSGNLNCDEKSSFAVGGIIGTSNSTVVSHCINNATIKGNQSAGIVSRSSGLWVGENGSDLISDCSNNGNIYGKAVSAGISLSGRTITNCINNGVITAHFSQALGIGTSSQEINSCTNYGKVGKFINDECNYVSAGIGCCPSINDCSNYGSITAEMNASGIAVNIGYGNWSLYSINNSANYGKISIRKNVERGDSSYDICSVASGVCDSCTDVNRCYNYGNIEGRKACGIVGNNKGTVSECFNSGSISSSKSGSGIAINNKDMVQTSYNNGSVLGNNAAGIVVNNNSYAVIMDCYNVGAINGVEGSAGIAVTNSNNVLDSYYFNGMEKGIVNNKAGATDNTVSLSDQQLMKQDSYEGFTFENNEVETNALHCKLMDSDDSTNSWVMSKQSGLPRLACMSDKEEVFIKDVKLKAYPKTKVVNQSITKSNISLLITYSNNKKATIKSGFKMKTYKKIVGNQKISLSYLGHNLTFKCKYVPAKVAKITLKTKKKTVKLVLSKTAGAKKYQIYRSTKKKSGFKKIKTIKGRKFVNKGLKSKKIYYYKARAINGKFVGAYSKVYKVKVK